MAATSAPNPGISLPFKPNIPITPPPDCLNFGLKSTDFSPSETKTTPTERFLAGMAATMSRLEEKKTAMPMPTAIPIPPSSPTVHESDCCPKVPELDSSSTTTATTKAQEPATPPPMDPRYLAMVSRVAAYYQQRSQAVANYQHQKCQAWANVQRQKCQEMTQAAMLVVAWYVRDRIQRRRRREKRQFRRALSERSKPAPATGAGVSRAKRATESIDKWIGRIPKDMLASPNTAPAENPADEDERGFSMDAEPLPADKDSKLFNVADNMIKSQLARIDVPLMGTLSFNADDSDDESHSDYEELHRWRPGGEDEAEPAGRGDDDMEDDDDDDYSDDDDMEEDFA